MYRHIQSLLNTAPAAISLIRRVGGDLVYEYANPGYEKLIGRTNLTGRKLYDVFPELLTDQSGLREIIEAVANEGKEFRSSELSIKLDWDGSGKITERFLNFAYEPVRDERGKPEGLTTFAFDITDQVRLRKQVEFSKLAIENERENFRNLFKQTPEMVCILKGPDHFFEFVNEAHVKVLGFDAAGKTVREAQPESVEVHGILDNVFSTGITAELHEIPITVTDRLRYFNLTYSARRDTDDTINGVMILGMEVTEEVKSRRRVQESEERLRFALATGSMGTWSVDLKTNAVTLSPESYGLFGMKQSAVDVDQTIDVAIHPEDRAKARAELSLAISRLDPYRSEYRIIREDNGAERWILATGSPRYDVEGEPDLYSGILMDITDRKNYEQDLHAAKEEADRANELKSAFLANMSHEIRTPLGAMLGFADLLHDPHLTAAERTNYTGIISRNGEQLNVIINDILDLSKVEAGHLSLEFIEVHPRHIAEDVVSLLQVKAKEKDLALEMTIEASAPETGISDPVRVRQVLLNLVANAIKFTPFGSIAIRHYADSDEFNRKRIHFEIRDTGIGIQKDQLENIFEVFVQADGSMTRRFGGTGLGLALSRKLARALGGDVTILSTAENKGTTFLFTFEDRPDLQNFETSLNPDGRAQELVLKPNALEGTKVLVVDDAPDNQQLIWRYLTKRGAIVESADNGFDGYKKALGGNFDIVLMDVQMPTMDGYTATEKLRSAGYRKPIIALTAHAMSEVRKKCLNVGCSDHLTKPINPQELVSAIVRHTQM